MALRNWLFGLFARRPRQDVSEPPAPKKPSVHVVILDGTLSTLKPGQETNAGLLRGLLLRQRGPNFSVYYEAGIQWQDWHSLWDVMVGNGLEGQIRRAYGVLASRYKADDHIFFAGYSRGAYAVRSLAGMIDLIGLLKKEHATQRNIEQAYRLYRSGGAGGDLEAFRDAYCHPACEISAIGVWDTVKALGVHLPFFAHRAEKAHNFHSDKIGPCIKFAFQALALDETRTVYRPYIWDDTVSAKTRVEQLWFKGRHGVIGGQIKDRSDVRALSNVPLVWMLEQLSGAGLPLPQNWQAAFPQDPSAPDLPWWSGSGIFFWSRKRRTVGVFPSESLHQSVDATQYPWTQTSQPKH